jgi:hypothetical protein
MEWLKDKCYYCESKLNDSKHGKLRKTRDHVVPKVLGGKGTGNYVPCCWECNSKKDKFTLAEWEQHLLTLYAKINLHTLSPATWKAKIPVILRNIRRHPLYNPSNLVNHRSFRKFMDLD